MDLIYSHSAVSCDSFGRYWSRVVLVLFVPSSVGFFQYFQYSRVRRQTPLLAGFSTQFTCKHLSSLQISPPCMLPTEEPRPSSRRSSETQMMYLNHPLGCHVPRLFMQQFQHMMVQWSGSRRLRPHHQLPILSQSVRLGFRCIQLTTSFTKVGFGLWSIHKL